MLIAIDTGATKTLIASFGHDGTVHSTEKFATPKDPHDYIELLTNTVASMADDLPLEAICLGVPGIVSGTTAEWCPNLGWKKFAVGEKLSKHFCCPIFVENDANLAALSEYRALKSHPSVCVYVTISTGIGVGVIVDGAFHPALKNIEAGHMVIEYDGRMREWESFASGRSFMRTYHAYAKDINDKHIWNQVADKISRGLAAIIPTLNPQMIIIGGSIGTHFDKYDTVLRHYVERYLAPEVPIPKLRRASRPEEAVMYGCYHHALDQLGS